ESSSVKALTWLTSGTAAETPEIFKKSRLETPWLEDDGLDSLGLSFLSCFAGFSGRSSTGCLHDFADQNDSKLRKRNCNSQGWNVSCGGTKTKISPRRRGGTEKSGRLGKDHRKAPAKP